MKFGEGSEGVEGAVADSAEISFKEIVFKASDQGLDEASSEGFDFLGGKGGPGSIEVGVGVSVDALKQVGDGEVD